ncbi:DUF6701 domain-containing protein [Aliikangiella coralliicola]|uniref:DUF6701 domain-containing protein n=1 Tax=Aliikangiella coralliicola TaxID=2592383 RepID=A0A545U693_9GAMM|nr:DUF6701 domain-containing protein [Aliikangiella coralliicola]TQV84998.1 hypothetical protein FLL46_21655 [Aliikangiella coralliicola]
MWTAFTLCLLASTNLYAAYVFQTVTGEAFDTVTTDVAWTNDASQTGFPTDDDYELVNIGFTFYLGETGYTQVRVLANGALHFGADQGFHKDYTNEPLAITGIIDGPGFEEAADRAILGYWDDLEPSLGGTVRYGTLGSAPNRRFVASWENVPRYNGPGTSYSTQIVIYENGNVRFRYGNDDVNGSSATIGIEVSNSDFTEFSYNTSNSVSDANDILWIREFPALDDATASCADPNTVTVTFVADISPARANDPSNFSIDNGVTVTGATYINSTTVELTTSTLTTGTTYTLSTTFPTQNTTFILGNQVNDTFIDQFSSSNYGNNDGTQNWAANWIESDDDGSATSGNVLISGNELVMDDFPNTGGEPAIERQVDLSTYISATLSLDLRTPNNLESSDRFDISVSSNGGASYTILQSFSNDVTGSFSYDISSFLATNTRIRLRIENNYGGSTEFIAIDNVTITATRVEPCAPAVDHFVITHDGNGINCLREAITITAVDSGGATVTDYAGTTNLSLSTAHGNWFTVDSFGASADPAQGTLTDTAGDNNGAATYEFVAADLGTVVLYLENTVAETANIGVAEGLITDDNSEGNITFRPYGFVFTPSPITTQVAGRPFNITLTAAGQTPLQPECGVIEEYNGVQALNFWSTYSSPTSSNTSVTVNGSNIAATEAASVAQNITFTNGVAVIAAQYNDVGQIGISAKDETGIGEPPAGSADEIIGGISPFVVRPFGYDIQISGDPYADDGNDDVFATAGNNFSMTIRSVLWQAGDDTNNDGVPDPFIDTDANGEPDSGGDLSNNGVTPNISQITGNIALTPSALVVTNSNGILSNPSVSFASFPAPGAAGAGSFTLNQSWSEVGILQIDAFTNDFMGGGQNVTGQRINIGRFIPDNFLMTAPAITEQCGTFTYAGFFDGVNAGLDRNGQTFDVSGSITARNSANAATLNYAGAFAKLTNSDIAVQPFNTNTGLNASGQVNFSPAALNFVNGVTNYSSPTTDYQFDSLAAAFNLRLDLTATDSDNVTSGTVNSNAFEVRLGRIRLIDSYGPEISDLEMRLRSEYYDGTSWIINDADSCTTYIQTDASFDAASYTDNLNAGETATFSPVTTQNLANGISTIANGIQFSAPGVNNYGSVVVNLNLTGQNWLSFDWDGDNTLDPTSGLLSFGYYRGSDRIIYWREIRN